MRSPKGYLLREVFHQKVADDPGIILIYAQCVEHERISTRSARWAHLLRLLSAYDTKVYALEHVIQPHNSFAQILSQSKRLLHELYAVHLDNKAMHQAIIFICNGTGGLLVKEAIAFAGEELAEWRKKLNHIVHITFLGTPHFGDSRDAYTTFSKGKFVSPYDALSSEDVSSLHLGAAQFVRTIQQIEPKPNIVSGYSEVVLKQSILKFVTPRGRSKLPVVTKDQSCIGIAEEESVLMDIEPQQLFNYTHESSFRNLIAERIRSSVDSYRAWLEQNRTPAIIVHTPTSSRGGSSSLPLRTPSTSLGFAFQDTPDSLRESNDDSSNRDSERLCFPLVFPRTAILQGPAHFQPRPEVSNTLDKSLLPAQMDSSFAPNLLTYFITGLGGVGKTELARDFAARKQREFDAIFFVVADHRERLSQQYAELASRLGLVKDQHSPDPEDAREKLKLWLKNPVKVLDDASEVPNRYDGTGEGKAKWLLVLDNAENPQVLYDFWPQLGFGSVLVTSRDPSIGIQINPPPDKLVLEGLSKEDTVTLLKKLTQNEHGSQEVADAADIIAERLDGLPLAIDQIASIVTRRCMSLPEFVRDYARPSDLHKLYDERRITTGYEHSLGSVWTFDSLEAEDKSAYSVLSVLSMWDSVCIQEEVVLKSLGTSTMSHYPQAKIEYNDALVSLIERSIIYKDRETGSLRLHRLVQDVMRARLAKSFENVSAAFDISWRAIAACFPYRDDKVNTFGAVHRWKKCSVMYTHVLHLGEVAWELLQTQDIVKIQFSPEFVGLLYEAAWWQCERREVAEAEPLITLSIKICELHSPDGESIHKDPGAFEWHQVSIWACKIFAAQTVGDSKTAFHFSQMRCKNAEDEYKETGKLRAFLPDAYNDLGQSYAMNRLYDQAISYFNKSAELIKQLPGFQKDWLCSPYYRMSITYHSMGDHKKAAKFVEEAIIDREEAFGQNDRVSSRTGLLYYILGNVRNSQSLVDEAYSHHHRAYLQCRQTAGESSLAALKCSQKLAEHNIRYGYDTVARPYLQNIIDICGERKDRKREVAQAAFALSELLQRQGDAGKSQLMREKAARLYASLRPESIKTASSLTSSDILSLTVFDYF